MPFSKKFNKETKRWEFCAAPYEENQEPQECYFKQIIQGFYIKIWQSKLALRSTLVCHHYLWYEKVDLEKVHFFINFGMKALNLSLKGDL